ncbi:putative zinc transporter msc2 [Serendipita sp. 411]|nr:putative zinc transporter msc2 [Serendipita sp. 411]
MVDSKLATENGTATFKAYIALLFYGSLQVVSTTASAHLANSFETVEVMKALTVLSAAALTIPIHLLGRTIGLLPPYPYVPLLALTPLPLLAFVLLFYYPHIVTSGLAYSPRSVFQLAYIPTAVMTCILSPLFSRQIAISDAPLAILLFYAQRPSSNLGPGGTRMQKSASEPFLRLLQGYINTILSNPESRKIFYFLIVNLAYMFVQLLYGVWTNSLGLISDAIHMAFDCMAIAMGLFASVMATWKPNERFTYGYSRIETLSGFANGIFLVLISVFIIVEAIQRLIDPPEMNTRQLLLGTTTTDILILMVAIPMADIQTTIILVIHMQLRPTIATSILNALTTRTTLRTNPHIVTRTPTQIIRMIIARIIVTAMTIPTPTPIIRLAILIQRNTRIPIRMTTMDILTVTLVLLEHTSLPPRIYD